MFLHSGDSDEEDMETSEDELEEVAALLSRSTGDSATPDLPLAKGNGMVTLPDQGELYIHNGPQLVSSADVSDDSIARLQDVDFDDLAG